MAKVSHFRFALRFFYTIFFLALHLAVGAQTLGGASIYNFLSFPSTTQTAAYGGINTSHIATDASFAMSNPALLHEGLQGRLGMHFNAIAAGVKALNLSGAFQHDQTNTTVAGNVFFVHYGSVQQTDAASNVLGNFNAYDYVVQASVAKQYLTKWQYGGSLKWIHSFYGAYSSSALALDVGLLFKDTTSGLRMGLVAKNMGAQLKGYTTEKEDLPFDLQIGVTKKLLKAPIAFSITAHHLHRFSILYNDTTFNRQNNFPTANNFFKRVFNHFVLATHVSVGQHLEASIGYNVLKRSELSVGNVGNGLSGFSAGLSATFQKLQFHYARTGYQKGMSNNQFGLSINLQQIGGTGLF